MLKYEWLSNLIEWIILFPKRLRARARSRSRYKARKEASATIRSTLEQFTSFNANNHRTIFNVALYLILLDQDLADFTDDIINATGDRKRAFIAKHEAILLYEASEDITQLVGLKFREAIKELSLSKEQMLKLDAASSNLNEFWRTNREFLRNIRNVLAAHRDHNALQYVEMLEQLQPLKVMHLAADLSDCINPLVSVLTDIALASSTPKSILEDWLTSSKKKRAP